MITLDLLNPRYENIFKNKSDKDLLESMTKMGLASTGERPSFSHSSQQEWEMDR